MAQLDQNLCLKKERKTKKKERKWETKERGVRLDVFNCPPTKPTLPYITITTLSLSHKKNMLPVLPFCKTPKNPIFITGLSKQQYFSPSYVGFFGFFLLVRVSHRKIHQNKNLLTSSYLIININNSFLLSSFIILSSFPLLSLYFSLTFSSFSLSIFSLPLVLSFFSFLL
jgi:hypothetical protein